MNLYLAIQDIKTAIRQYRIWLYLGSQDVKQRYRRSTLGPWWITLSMAIFILAMGLIFSRVFAQKTEEYIPFFTAGYLVWLFISMSIVESTELLRSHGGFIRHMKLPYNLYVLKFMTKNIIVFIHNFFVYLLVLICFEVNPGWQAILAIPGFFLLAINVYWMCLITALLSTRFRDIVPIVTSCMQLAFFVTPISWMANLIGENSLFIKLNPFAYFVNIVRDPLLGKCPPLEVWLINVCLACIGVAISVRIFSQVRTYIPFWVD